MLDTPYEDFIRTRITQLRIAKDVSEHRMSLFLDQQAAPKQPAAIITAIISLLNNTFASFIITPILFTFIISIF